MMERTLNEDTGQRGGRTAGVVLCGSGLSGSDGTKGLLMDERMKYTPSPSRVIPA